jgi:hypothetical protein
MIDIPYDNMIDIPGCRERTNFVGWLITVLFNKSSTRTLYFFRKLSITSYER